MNTLALPTVDDVDALPAEALGSFLLQLTALQGRAALRLLASASPAPPGGQPERLLTVKEAADRCSTSADWIYRHKDALPFIRRLGRTVRVSEAALARWMARRAQ
jgi:excisionase family DNA binding protein